MSAIAIVGLGCRFAGAPDPTAFWKLCVDGRSAFREVPPERFDVDVYLDTNPRAVDKTYTKVGALLDDVRTFPALALGIPPRRAEVMDPQHRLAIEVVREAIADAGHSASTMPPRTGVFFGATSFEYRSLQAHRLLMQASAAGLHGTVENPDALMHAVENIVPARPYSAPGLLGNMTAAMCAQELDLHGPAYTVDAACASALVAIQNAVQQLRAGAIDAAVAGGVYVQVTAENYVAFSRVGAISASGVCRPFDSRADGFVLGEGAGVVVLKRLDDAERDGDRVYAVLHGIATNNDGRGDGPMAPAVEGQADVIFRAWEQAGLDPARLGYHEAHGTGTDTGDPAELRGLRIAIGERATNVALGSVKGNIGHTNSAAGVAGLIRAILAVHHSAIPPMAGFESSRPDLKLDEGPFRVPTKVEVWSDADRLASVSSFGFGGTNAHAIVGPAPKASPRPIEQPELVVVSAPTEVALRALAGRTAAAIRADQHATLAGVAKAWALHRKQTCRLAIVANSLEGLAISLEAVSRGEQNANIRIGLATGPRKVAFLFPGQGAQRVGMIAKIARRFPAVADALYRLEAELDGELTVPLTHLLWPELRHEAVTPEVAAEQLTDTANCQPAMHAVGIALAGLLRTVGITPVAVTGHSLGEFTAAAVGGVLDAGDAARFVARRGRAMAALPGDHGAMVALMCDADKARELLVPGAVIANFNHPRQLVISGTTTAVAEVAAKAAAAGIKAVPLVVSHAFHSPVLADLDAASLLEGVAFANPKITVASGIADRPYADANEAKGVFLRHATSPVDFVGALAQCKAAGADIFLQIGAGGPLASFARGSLPGGSVVMTLASIDDAEGATSLLDTLAQLWVLGVDLDPRPLCASADVASVPPEVLPREDYWLLKEERQQLPKLKGRTIVATAVPAVAPTVAAKENAGETPAPTSSVEDQVLSVVAKVSAWPKDQLKVTMSLQDDLGFDSLMVGDLATGLADAFPGLGGIPQELLVNRPTVADIVGFAQSGGQGATATNDDATLGAYTTTWVEAALPDAPARSIRKGARAIVVGSADPANAIVAALNAAGVEAMLLGSDAATKADPVDLIVWVTPKVPVAKLAPAALIATLANQAKQDRNPDLLVIGHDSASAGVARAIAREWPSAIAKNIQSDDAAAILAEWTSVERTTDVVYRSGRRYVRGLVPARLAPAPIGDVVAITGGTRGIGSKLAKRLVDQGKTVLLVGRGEPDSLGKELIAAGKATHARADVTDVDALTAAFAGKKVSAIVHAAGVLADGPLEKVPADQGGKSFAVKSDGFAAAIRAAGPSLKVALAIGSWSGRFGSRHQIWYAAGNAALESELDRLPAGVRGVVAEFGPWSGSEMAKGIPAPVVQAMRSEGVDFVGDEAGLDALLADLNGAQGVVVHGRDLPPVLRHIEQQGTFSVDTHPFLKDHAIEGHPVLPLAAAADLLARTAGVTAPFEITDLTLFQGVVVDAPLAWKAVLRNDRVELRVGDKKALAYRARVRPYTGSTVDAPPVRDGKDKPATPLKDFYGPVAFHGPLLQGVVQIRSLDASVARGTVKTGDPKAWMTAPPKAWAVDPYALDSAMQVSGYSAWQTSKRFGTPIGIARLVQLRPWPAPGTELDAQIDFGASDGDRSSATITLRDAQGPICVVFDAAAEIRRRPDDEVPEIKREWIDASAWPGVKDLEMRLEGAKLIGIANPYFAVHEGTARNTTVVAGREMINFSSYNYLGLSGDPRVLADVKAAVDKYGTSVSASRVASGERPFHNQLERELAACQGYTDSLVFTAGHATNVTTIGHLYGAKDLILHDELIHDSALQGIKLSGAQRRSFKHDDPAHLEQQLRQLRKMFEKVLIIVEGVYSMDGDICQLPEYIRIKQKWGCMLMVDEAHSFGVVGATGQGLREHFGIRGDEVDLWMGTLSKSVASCGGWIAASDRIVNYLRYTAPGFVFSAGLTPANGQAALSSLRLMLAEPWRVQRLQANAQRFHDGLVSRGVDTGPAKGGSAVVPAVTGNSMHALMLSDRLKQQGINVQPIVYPAVADDAARLRFFLSSTHTDEQLDHTAKTVAETLEAVRRDAPVR